MALERKFYRIRFYSASESRNAVCLEVPREPAAQQVVASRDELMSGWMSRGAGFRGGVAFSQPPGGAG